MSVSSNNTIHINLKKDHISRQQIESILGFRVKNVQYYQKAFVHKSILGITNNTKLACREYMKESYERLEFLGDKVLDLAVTTFLYRKYPKENEGFLSTVKIRIVKGKTLANLSRKMGLGKHLIMTQQAEKAGVRTSYHILEDILEALIGAIYYDFGFEEGFHKAYGFVTHILEKYINFKKLMQNDNYKDILKNYTQSIKTIEPVYKIIKTEGPSHRQRFTMEVLMFGERYGTGEGFSKKDAEQLAAKEALEKIKNMGGGVDGSGGNDNTTTNNALEMVRTLLDSSSSSDSETDTETNSDSDSSQHKENTTILLSDDDLD